ncbi:MAG: NUDIX domain-containing protein [Waddliaceae bacterium]
MKSSVVAIVFKENERKVLAIQRRDCPVWVLPGGKIEESETPEKAVIRETFEETGCRVSIKRKIGQYTPVIRLLPLTHVFECRIENGKLRTGQETRDIDFFPFEHLPKRFFSIHEDMLNDALKNSPEVIDKQLTQVTYSSIIKYLIRHPILFARFALSQIGFPINSRDTHE